MAGLLRRLMGEANEELNLRRCLTRLLLEELSSVFPGLRAVVRARLMLSGVMPEEAEPEAVVEALSRYADPELVLRRLGASSLGELLEKHRGRLRKLCKRRKLL